MTPSPRRLAAPIALVAVLAGCGGGSEARQSTTSPPPATTLAPTTTAPATTTTTATPATTTTVATTTTLAPATTAPPPPGQALVATVYGTLGWYDPGTGQWVTAPSAGDLPEVEGAEFDVVALDGTSTTVAASVDECEITGNALITFQPELPGERRLSGSVAVLGATWELVPRPVTADEPPAERIQTVLDHLATMGIDETDPPFLQYVETDLDGDGDAEAVLAAARGEALAGPGDYSVVMLFGDGVEAVVSESYGVAENPYVLNLVVAAVADLDGDGAMEVVFDSSYYEGSGSAAHVYSPEPPALTQVIGGGCGA